MTVALRVMGNLVTDEDRDLTARAWRTAGRLSLRLGRAPAVHLSLPVTMPRTRTAHGNPRSRRELDGCGARFAARCERRVAECGARDRARRPVRPVRAGAERLRHGRGRRRHGVLQPARRPRRAAARPAAHRAARARCAGAPSAWSSSRRPRTWARPCAPCRRCCSPTRGSGRSPGSGRRRCRPRQWRCSSRSTAARARGGCGRSARATPTGWPGWPGTSAWRSPTTHPRPAADRRRRTRHPAEAAVGAAGARQGCSARSSTAPTPNAPATGCGPSPSTQRLAAAAQAAQRRHGAPRLLRPREPGRPPGLG